MKKELGVGEFERRRKQCVEKYGKSEGRKAKVIKEALATNATFATMMQSSRRRGHKKAMVDAILLAARDKEESECFDCRSKVSEKEERKPVTRSVTAPGGKATAQGNRFSLRSSKLKGDSEMHFTVNPETESAVGNPTVSRMSAVDGDSDTGGDSTADNAQVSEGEARSLRFLCLCRTGMCKRRRCTFAAAIEAGLEGIGCEEQCTVEAKHWDSSTDGQACTIWDSWVCVHG